MKGGLKILDKTIQDIFKLGSGAVFYEKQYVLDEIMILGTSERLYTVLRGFQRKMAKTLFVA